MVPIVYFEIAGPDAAALAAFYQEAFGWRIDGGRIAAATTGGLAGGIRQDPAEKVLYLGVPDIGAALAAVVKAGGTVVIPRTVVPNVVTFALFEDPAGNRTGLTEVAG